MAKDKAKGAKGVPNKHLHARISFLHQAALYLAAPSSSPAANPVDGVKRQESGELRSVDVPESGLDPTEDSSAMAHGMESTSSECPHENTGSPKPADHERFLGGLPILLSSQLRQVALKSQIRLQAPVKHAICKTCDSVLVEGQSCKKYVENLSRTRKSHADVLVVECFACGTKRRYPIGSGRQKSKKGRNDCTNKANGASPPESSGTMQQE